MKAGFRGNIWVWRELQRALLPKVILAGTKVQVGTMKNVLVSAELFSIPVKSFKSHVLNIVQWLEHKDVKVLECPLRQKRNSKTLFLKRDTYLGTKEQRVRLWVTGLAKSVLKLVAQRVSTGEAVLLLLMKKLENLLNIDYGVNQYLRKTIGLVCFVRNMVGDYTQTTSSHFPNIQNYALNSQTAELYASHVI